MGIEVKIKFADVVEALQWTAENCPNKSKFREYPVTDPTINFDDIPCYFIFDNETDAVMFTLKWS